MALPNDVAGTSPLGVIEAEGTGTVMFALTISGVVEHIEPTTAAGKPMKLNQGING